MLPLAVKQTLARWEEGGAEDGRKGRATAAEGLGASTGLLTARRLSFDHAVPGGEADEMVLVVPPAFRLPVRRALVAQASGLWRLGGDLALPHSLP